MYNNLNLPDKSYEVNHWTVAEHPDYLFGKLNLAAEYFFKEEYDRMPEVLGESMELKQLYPQRDTFHISEVVGFFKISILYFSAIGDLEQAEIRLDILKEIAPDSEELETARQHYDLVLLKDNFIRREEEREKEINVKPQKIVLTNIETPSFKEDI